MLSAQNTEVSRLYAARNRILKHFPVSKRYEKKMELDKHIESAIIWWCNAIANQYEQLNEKINFIACKEKPITSVQFEIFVRYLKKEIKKHFKDNDTLILTSCHPENMLLSAARKADIAYFLLPRDINMQLTQTDITFLNKTNTNLQELKKL